MSAEQPGRPGSGSTGDYAGNVGSHVNGCCPHDPPLDGVIITMQTSGTTPFATKVLSDGEYWFSDISFKSISDGLSKTIFAGEKHMPPAEIGTWPHDSSIYNGDHIHNWGRIGGRRSPIAKGPNSGSGIMEFGSWHPGVTNFLYGDGRVAAASVAMDTLVLEYSVIRDDGQVAGNGS